jgi:hypothetical protein
MNEEIVTHSDDLRFTRPACLNRRDGIARKKICFLLNVPARYGEKHPTLYNYSILRQFVLTVFSGIQSWNSF